MTSSINIVIEYSSRGRVCRHCGPSKRHFISKDRKASSWIVIMLTSRWNKEGKGRKYIIGVMVGIDMNMDWGHRAAL
ncbi:unnamed protein product [Rhodiola kirilowii]